jgi:hypothetical protein
MGRFDIRTRTGLISPIIQGVSGLDTDAVAFFNRVTAAGGSLTSAEINSINQLVMDLKASGIWSSMTAIYPMVGASAAACAQNLVSSSYTGTFNGGWTYASTGVTPNGTNAYMNTGLASLSALSQNSNHMSFYSRSNIAAGAGGEMGGYSISGPKYFHMQLFYPGNIAYILLATATNPSINNTGSLGFFNGNRNSPTNISLIKNGTNIGSTTVASTSLNTFNIYICALNQDGNTGSYSTKQCAFASIGAGLSDTQAANFYTNVQAFQTSLSRNV